MLKLLGDKKAIGRNLGIITLIGILLLIILILIPKIPAAKIDQYYLGNLTCEQSIDSVLWTVTTTKSVGPTTLVVNWTPATPCGGNKSCDMVSIYSFVRFINPSAKVGVIGDSYSNIANETESALGTYSRYSTFLNISMPVGEIEGPRWECGGLITWANTTCNTTGKGYTNSTGKYKVRVYAAGGSPTSAYYVTDIFNIKYNWCWIPIIENITVSPDSATYADTFTFKVNVTNPSANTTVRLMTKIVGGAWAQRDVQYCANCSRQTLTFSVSNFVEGNIGNWEFKFNATDDAGATIEAGNPSTIGTRTNECLDTNNDCLFVITDVAAAGIPNVTNWTVQGVTSGATDGWGINWTFSTNVSNPADGVGNINLSLYLNTSTQFVYKGSQICNSPCLTGKFTFYLDDLSCSDMSNANYRFSATNTNGTTNKTESFTIEADDINIIYVQGNNSIANRSGNQTDLLVVRINDTDNRTIVFGGVNTTFYVKFNSISYDSGNLNTTNSSGYASHYFNATCTPTKHLVGDRDWQANASGNVCYKNTGSQVLNLSVKGDILLEFATPSGTSNYTQEDLINFLGATTDDCGDSLISTVRYNANLSGGSGFACTNTTKVGANVFTCDYATTTATETGYYNTTMFSNVTNHYNNFTQKTNTPGLFYLFPLRRLASNNVTPNSEFYYYPNWNFTITATSGDNIPMRIELYLKKGSGGFTQCNESYQCENITTIYCENCQNQVFYWYKNFTSSDTGTWFYQIKMINNNTEAIEAQTAGTDSFAVNYVEPETINFFNIQQTPSSAQWGGTTVVLNVTVNTSVTRNVTVYAWNSLYQTGPWNLVGTATHSNITGGNQILNFTKQTNSGDIGTNYYFFNATDNAGTTNASSVGSYTITKDYINLIYLAGNNEIANRSGNQTTRLSFRAVNANGTVMNGFPTKYSVTTNNIAYYTDNNFIVLTNSTGYANLNFNATCAGEYSGALKFAVGEQKWKVQLNDSLLDYYFDNDSSIYLYTNISMRGDIKLEFTTPTGAVNYTQEGTISFLGATTDDCGDALVTTVVYDTNSTTSSFQCTNNTQIGANAFQCNYLTTLATERGWHNVTMNANKTNHYNNLTSNIGNPGLFYILPKKKLQYPTGVPSSAGWGYPNWNFSVLASSGDIDNILQTDLFMARSVNPTTQCTSPTCVNQTSIICDNCTNQVVTYYRNFTDSNPAANTIGTWYYQFKLNDTALTSTSGTAYSVVVTKDSNNITYGGTGNATVVEVNTSAQWLSVKVFDIDKNSYNVTSPSANITFKLLDAGYTESEKIIGYNTTNETGHATFFFNATVCTYVAGPQVWVGEIESAEPNYQQNISQNFTLNITLTGCAATVSVDSTLTPDETFQYRNFTINSTINSFGGDSNDINVTLQVPDEWIVGPNRTQSLGTIAQGTPTPISWIVNATTYGTNNATIFANSSNAGSDSLVSDNFAVYKEFPSTSASETLPQIISGGSSLTTSWDCSTGDYRVAMLNINVNTSNSLIPIRVETYNGTQFVDILHSRYTNTSYDIETIKVQILQNQINSNETGSCTARISNLGSDNIGITAVNLEAYYDETVSIKDIQASALGANVTGIENNGTLFNVSILLDNSINQIYWANVTLNITNSSGISVNSSTNQNVVIGALSTATTNFLNINTTNWTSGNYTLNTYITGNFTKGNNRSEILIFDNVQLYVNNLNYICNLTTEELNITIYHPFTDRIEYNVSLEMPAGWNYSGYQLINISTMGNTSLIFNITSSNAASENVIINATINYTYPGTNKLKRANHSVEEGNNLPILELIRESPGFVANRTEFFSRIAVYNKGCASATSISLTENVLTGWTAYSPTVDGTSAGTSDIPNGEIRYTSSDFGTIKAKEYKILEYRLLPPTGIKSAGTLRYNLTWGSRNHYEFSDFKINTSDYQLESHLSYNLRAVGSFKGRSAELNEDQLYEFNITNRGDLNITNSTWNVSISIPSQCSQSNHTGIFNDTTRKITWNLGALNKSLTNTFFFNMNCTTENKYILTAEGTNDTRITTNFENNTEIGCAFSSGNSCLSITNYIFTKIVNARYERLDSLHFLVFYNFTDYNMTIGQGFINLTDDLGRERIVWQNYSLNPAGSSNTIWTNYTIDSDKQEYFSNAGRNIGVKVYVDSTSAPKGNVTIQQLQYSWNQGKLFSETQNLFVDIHPFIFDLSTPTLQTPLNASLQAAEPVGLSWQAISAPEGINITYYIFGDTIDASTLLTSTTENLYLWRNLVSGTYYWKVIASDGTSNTTSETRQFTLDLCQPDTNYIYALNYPMSYNNITDTITIWGSNGTGYTAMGNSTSNPITFENIYEFGRAARGICAIIKPTTGSYAMLSRLELGNISSLSNTTFVKTSGESIDFGKQLQFNFNSTLTSGLLSSTGNPYSGSTLSFSGTDANNTGEGELYMKAGSYLKLYDSTISHKLQKQNTNPFKFYIYGTIIAKRTTFQNIWYIILLNGEELNLEDVVFTNMGIGLYPHDSSDGFRTIYIRYINDSGLYLNNGVNLTVTILEISESTNDVKIVDYEGTANLVNSNLNWSNLNWSAGTFSGQLNRKYDYSATTVDIAGSAVSNVSMVMLDLRGDNIFNLLTSATGTIPSQTITRAIYNYNYKTGDERGPHTLRVKKFGKNFVSIAKQFSAATIETLQLTNNPFVTLSESQVLNLTGIYYNPPTKINYGDEIWGNFTTSGNLNKTPVTQSEFFNVFGYDGINDNRKLTLVTTPISNGEYSVNYQTGALVFFNNQSGHNVTPVYSYRGNITIATGTASENCISMSDLYSYMQYNLSETLQTVDGNAYVSYVHLVIGNSTTGGCIVDSTASLTFEDGYTYSFSPIGGYIDLFGVTAGSGTGGGLPLHIYSDVGTTYEPGDTVYISSITFDSEGNLVSSVVDTTVYYPNETIFSTGLSTEISTGRYRYNFTLGGSVPEGTYRVDIDATYLENEVHNTLVFQVSISGGGSANPEVIVEAPAIVNTNTNFSIYAFSKSDSGLPVDCSSGANLTVTNLITGTNILSGVSMTKFNTGEYNYTWWAEDQSSYLAKVVCTISGTDYTGITTFSTLDIGGSSAQPYVDVGVTPDIADMNQSVSIIASTYSNSSNLVNCSGGAVVSIRDIIGGTYVVSDDTMTNFETGRYNYTWNPTNTSNYLVTVVCTISGDVFIGEDVFSVTRGFSADLLDVGEVAVGKNYNTILRIYNTYGLLIDADKIPTITLVDPNGNAIISNAAMTWDSAGTYTYSFATTGYTAGNWKTTANLTVDGVIYYLSESWELESTYADVSNPVITDNTIPSITATAYISNNGTAGSDFEIVYCIVTTPENTCGGTDDVSIATTTKYFNSTEIRLVTLDGLVVSTIGNYYFRVQVRPISATETATGLSSFTAISTELPPVTPPSGGGGGGAAIPITPKVVEEEAIENVSYMLKIFTRILPKYQHLVEGDDTMVVEITLQNFGTVEYIKGADLEYFIEDKDGEIYISKREDVTIDGKTVLLREIDIPRDMKAGEYWFVGKIKYLEKGSVSRERFEIAKKEKLIVGRCCLGNLCWFKFLVCWYWWTLLVIAILIRIGFIVYKKRIYEKRMGEMEKLKNLKKLVRYIRRGK